MAHYARTDPGIPVGRRVGDCGKRCFDSAHQAREAHSRASYRVRPYWCQTCHAYHVANAEKGR